MAESGGIWMDWVGRLALGRRAITKKTKDLADISLFTFSCSILMPFCFGFHLNNWKRRPKQHEDGPHRDTPINGRLVATNKNVAQAKSPARGLGKKSCSP